MRLREVTDEQLMGTRARIQTQVCKTLNSIFISDTFCSLLQSFFFFYHEGYLEQGKATWRENMT